MRIVTRLAVWCGVVFLAMGAMRAQVTSVTGSTGISVSPTTGATVVTNTAPLTSLGLQSVLAASPFLGSSSCRPDDGTGSILYQDHDNPDGTPTCALRWGFNGDVLRAVYASDSHIALNGSDGSILWAGPGGGILLGSGGANFVDAIDLGGNKVTSLHDGTVSTDAAAFGQIIPNIFPSNQTVTQGPYGMQWGASAPSSTKDMFTLTGGMTTTAITGYSIASGVITFTAVNGLTEGSFIQLSGFPASTFLNNVPLLVLATGLSGTQFKANFTHAPVSPVTESGVATPLPPLTNNQPGHLLEVVTQPNTYLNPFAVYSQTTPNTGLTTPNAAFEVTNGLPTGSPKDVVHSGEAHLLLSEFDYHVADTNPATPSFSTQFRMDGKWDGPGFDVGSSKSSASGWTVGVQRVSTMIATQRGIHQSIGGTMEKSAIGDTDYEYVYVTAFGGAQRGDDEGVVGRGMHLFQRGFVSGKVDSSTTGTGIASVTANSVNCSSPDNGYACTAYYDAYFADGGLLLDTAGGGGTFTIVDCNAPLGTNAPCGDAGAFGGMSYDITGGTVTPSSAWGNIIPSSCVNNGPAQYQFYTATTCTVNLVSGTFTTSSGTSSHIYLAGQFEEEAAVTAAVANDPVTKITVTNGGSGYSPSTTVNISGVGSGATARATVAGGVITAITITSNGTGYTTAPTISFSGGGSGATATASIPSGAYQTLTFNTRYAWNDPDGNTLVMQGGPGGQALVATGSDSWPIAYFVLGATSSTRIYFSNCVGGECTGTASFGNAIPPASTYLFGYPSSGGTLERLNGVVKFSFFGNASSDPRINLIPTGSKIIMANDSPSSFDGDALTITSNSRNVYSPSLQWKQSFPVTGWSIAAGVVTFAATNSLTAGQAVYLDDFPTSAGFFNGQTVTVLAMGLSGSHFSANITHIDDSGSEHGSFAPNETATTTGALSEAPQQITLYPAAFIIGTNNGQPGQAQLATNDVTFSTNDSLVGAPTAQYRQAGHFLYQGQTTASEGSVGYAVADAGPAPMMEEFSALNAASTPAPMMFYAQGAFDKVFAIRARPADNGCILCVSGDEPVAGISNIPYTVFQDAAGGNSLVYRPPVLPTPSQLSYNGVFSAHGLDAQSQKVTSVANGTASSDAVAFGQLGSAAFKSTGTSGGVVPLLNQTNVFSAQQQFPGVNLGTGINVYGGAADFSVASIMLAPTLASGGGNVASPPFKFIANYWTGSGSTNDVYTFVDTLPNVTNPATVLSLTHTGSPGGATFSVGFPMAIGSSGQAKIDASGNSTFTSTTNTKTTFSALPACSSTMEGRLQAVTDSTTDTWGATITGGGSDHVLAYCDGTNWTVAAK